MQEQLFFTDSAKSDNSALERLMGVVMALAAEVYILRDRNLALENLLEQAGVLKPAALDSFQDTPEARQAQLKERDAFVARVLSPIMGQEK